MANRLHNEAKLPSFERQLQPWAYSQLETTLPLQQHPPCPIAASSTELWADQDNLHQLQEPSSSVAWETFPSLPLESNDLFQRALASSNASQESELHRTFQKGKAANIEHSNCPILTTSLGTEHVDSRLAHHVTDGPTETEASGSHYVCYQHGCNGRSFANRSNYLRHFRERQTSESVPYCSRCGQTFTRKEARDKHHRHNRCKRTIFDANGVMFRRSVV
jgi:hypothetical protein